MISQQFCQVEHDFTSIYTAFILVNNWTLKLLGFHPKIILSDQINVYRLISEYLAWTFLKHYWLSTVIWFRHLEDPLCNYPRKYTGSVSHQTLDDFTWVCHTQYAVIRHVSNFAIWEIIHVSNVSSGVTTYCVLTVYLQCTYSVLTMYLQCIYSLLTWIHT